MPAQLKMSNMAENLIGSEIIKLANEINERIKKGEKISNLTIGDFDPAVFPIPTVLLNEIIEAYKAGHTNYPVANGMPELRQAVSLPEESVGKSNFRQRYLLWQQKVTTEVTGRKVIKWWMFGDGCRDGCRSGRAAG